MVDLTHLPTPFRQEPGVRYFFLFFSPDLKVLICAPARRGVNTLSFPDEPVEHVIVGFPLLELSWPQQVTELAVVRDAGVAGQQNIANMEINLLTNLTILCTGLFAKSSKAVTCVCCRMVATGSKTGTVWSSSELSADSWPGLLDYKNRER